MKNLKRTLTCLGILLSYFSYSQVSPPLGSLPMLYNGGFAGESGQGRLALGIQTSKRLWNGNFSGYGSYDHFFSKISTGIGLTAIVGTQNAYILSISPKISFKGKYTLAPFVEGSYISDKFEGGGGFLFNSQKFYLGYSLTTFASFLQIGYSFQRLPESVFSFTPQLVFQINSISRPDIDIPAYSFIFRYKKFITGINDNGLALGYQGKKDKIVLSQNYLFFWTRNESAVNLSYRHFFELKSNTSNW
jgi:hypothetical protein